MRFILFILLFMAGGVYASEDYEEFEDYGIKRYKMGNRIYSSPPTVEYHLSNVDGSCYLYWLFQHGWELKVLQAGPSTDETKQKISEIIHTQLSGNDEYIDIRGDIVQYVEPNHLPKQLAFKLGMLMTLHGNFLKELETDQFDKRLELYKNSLLLFSYSLGFSENAPAILQHEDLDALASHPEFSTEVDSCFQKAFATVDEKHWIEKLLKVQENSKYLHNDHVECTIYWHEVSGLLRSIYLFFLENRDSLPGHYEAIAAHLYKINTKVVMEMQKDPNYHLDAANVRLFQAYLDLRKWKSIGDQMLLNEVETRCVKLMPHLEEINEKNEFAVCEAVRMRNFTPTNRGNRLKEEEILDESPYSEYELQGYLCDLHCLHHEMTDFGLGKSTWIYEHLISDWSFQIYNYVSGYIEISDLPITQENAEEYLLRIKTFDIRTALWNSQHTDRFYFSRSTYKLRQHIHKLCPHLTSQEVLTNWIDMDKLRAEHDKKMEEFYSQKYKLGNWYYSSPTTIEYHLQHVDELCYLYWLFHYAWEVKVQQAAPATDETQQKIIEIVQNHLSGNEDYKDIRGNIIEYVDPNHLPKQLAFKLGMLMTLHGNFLEELEPYQFDKRLELYKNCLLLFSYSLGFSESAPAILQHEDLDALASNPEFSAEVDSYFQNTFATIDEEAWIEKLLLVQQNSKSHDTDHHTISLYQVCGLLRSIYCFFLNNRDSLPPYYGDIAAHLCNINTKVVLETQKKPNVHIDGANVRLFQAYIDLKKWESICDPSLLPLVKTRCVKLMPRLEEIKENNEFAICQAVRMRNLIPTNQGDWQIGEKIINEFSFSQWEIQNLLLDHYRFLNEMARFGRGYETYIDDTIKDWCFQIYNYVSGYIELSDLPITQENALEYLYRIKVFDIATALWNSHYHPVKLSCGGLPHDHSPFDQFHFPRSTYELRKHILKICPQLRTYEVFTNSINPDKLRDEKENLIPDDWISESEFLRQACVNELLQKALKLSEMMEQSPLQGIIVGTRGISGAGKSTFLKKNILSLLPSEDGIEGVLNPDTIKSSLRKLQGDTINIQVHEEAINAFKQVFSEVSDKGSYILDRMNLSQHDIVANLVEPAKNGGRSVWLYDFDIPLSTCFYRILARPLHGADPCPEYEVLIKSYLSLRRHRKQVVDFAVNEDTIGKYELYAQQRLIAQKAGQHLCVHDEKLFAESIREPDFPEIEEELSQVIDDASITKAIANGVITQEQRELIEQWKGMTLKNALQLHVQAGKGTFDESLFEAPVFYHFDGDLWLADRPYLLDFIQNEHLMHTHGVDENGRGLHWEARETGLNPRYAPEGHFQMKLGYFMVPRGEYVNLQTSGFYSDTDKDLGIDFSNWYYRYALTVRLFVHPEAYAHFAPLLRAGIPFVPPSESEYMGTPTSSYNTWLVRNLSNDNDPFLLKMGTPNGSGDIKHLLASEDIIKSLANQQKLYKLPTNPDFTLFREAAGVILKNIPGYPGGTIDSGIIFCELPTHLLSEEGKMISFDSLISCERLPLIYELMETAIQKGIVDMPKDFLQKYFIDAYLKAIEQIVFKEGYALTGGHLYLTLHTDNTIKGFAYRDLQSVDLMNGFLESYTWSYRYANFIKLLNVLTRSETDTLPPHEGAPIRVGTEKPSSERSLYHYLCTKLDDEIVQRLSISPEEAADLLKQLDSAYLVLLKTYFTIDEAAILNSDGTIPCAEKGSLAEKKLRQLNQILRESRK